MRNLQLCRPVIRLKFKQEKMFHRRKESPLPISLDPKDFSLGTTKMNSRSEKQIRSSFNSRKNLRPKMAVFHLSMFFVGPPYTM